MFRLLIDDRLLMIESSNFESMMNSSYISLMIVSDSYVEQRHTVTEMCNHGLDMSRENRHIVYGDIDYIGVVENALMNQIDTIPCDCRTISNETGVAV